MSIISVSAFKWTGLVWNCIHKKPRNTVKENILYIFLFQWCFSGHYVSLICTSERFVFCYFKHMLFDLPCHRFSFMLHTSCSPCREETCLGQMQKKIKKNKQTMIPTLLIKYTCGCNIYSLDAYFMMKYWTLLWWSAELY